MIMAHAQIGRVVEANALPLPGKTNRASSPTLTEVDAEAQYESMAVPTPTGYVQQHYPRSGAESAKKPRGFRVHSVSIACSNAPPPR